VDKNGEYVSTLDGDKFMIVSSDVVDSSDKTQLSNYIKSYEEQENTRGNYKITFGGESSGEPVPSKVGAPREIGDNMSVSPSSQGTGNGVDRLRRIWPEGRVPDRYWFRYSDGGGRGQSFGRFQFFRDTFTKFMAYVREKAPSLWNSLSDGVKTKIMAQTEQFKSKPAGYRFNEEEKARIFLNEGEANELLSKVFKSSNLDYEFRGMILQEEIIPAILKLGNEIPEYRNTINQLVNDDRYLAGVYDILNQCGVGGAKKF